jgi:hypothetical protein
MTRVHSDELESLRNEVARLVTENRLLRRSVASAVADTSCYTSSERPWLGNETVPLMTVADMSTSVRFYVDAVGFSVTNKWVDDDGVLRWCQLRHGGAGLMLQQRVDGTERPVLSHPNHLPKCGSLRSSYLPLCLCVSVSLSCCVCLTHSPLAHSLSSDGTQRQPNESICLCIFCEDAIAVWNELRRRGCAHPTHPQVLNGLCK